MMPRSHREDDDPNPDDGAGDAKPSKSARKRAAHDAQRLGQRLVELRDGDLERLNLPERLVDAIRAARSIRAHGALARQRQLIGKLMRDVDPAPILDALEARGRFAAIEAERFRRVEGWRDRLLREGETGLDALREWRPAADFDALRTLLATARDATAPAAARSAASRELFRRLRAALDPGDGGGVSTS
jgi:ribosome-associated protein